MVRMTVHRLGAWIGAFAALLVGLVAGPQVLAQGVVGEPQPWQMGLQDGVTPVSRMMIEFHDLLMVIITLIVLVVLGLLLYVMVRFNAKANPTPSKMTHNTLVEVVWTVVPVLILIVIAVPSFRLLYFAERLQNAEMTVKVTGRQWYWEYDYPDHGGINLMSFMLQDDELEPGQRRLLEVDNRLVLPVDTDIRILVTAGDVLHSFYVPAFGIKMDAIPGRLNETWVRVEQEGVYYGHCTELCGVGHAYMPVAVEAVSKQAFEAWVTETQTAQGLVVPAQTDQDVALAGQTAQ